MRDDGTVDADRTRALMDLLAGTGWVDAARGFAGGLRRSALTSSGDLLLVGTPNFEPWHFAAHLTDEAQFAGVPELAPVLVRWQVPPGASTHLAVPLQRLELAGRGETLLVVTDEAAPVPLLERAWDARKAGATVLALDAFRTWTPMVELGEGGLERWIVYPIVLWLVAFGSYLMATPATRAPHAGSRSVQERTSIDSGMRRGPGHTGTFGPAAARTPTVRSA